MNIKEKFYIFFIAKNILFKMINFWMKSLAGKKPLTIDIISWNIGTIIPIDNSINIHHGHYLYQKLLSKFNHLFSVREQSFDDSLHDEGRRCFARMLSPNDVNDGFILLHSKIIRNVQNVNVVP